MWKSFSCVTLCFSVCGILQAGILEWVVIPFSRGSFWPRDWTHVSCIAGRFFTIWAARKPHSTFYVDLNGNEIQKEGRYIYICMYTHTHTYIHIHTYIYIHMAGELYYTAETKTTLWNNYTPMNVKFNHCGCICYITFEQLNCKSFQFIVRYRG